MQKEIQKLNKLLDKLDKHVKSIKDGAVMYNSTRCPLKVQRLIHYKKTNMYLIVSEQLNEYIAFDAEIFDKAFAVKETI